MDELDLIIAYADLTCVQTQLQDWKQKAKNPELFDKLINRLIESQTYFRGLEKELRISKQRQNELSFQNNELQTQNDGLTKQVDELLKGL